MQRLFLAGLFLVLGLTNGFAWASPNWPYSKLFAESDLVVIAVPVLTVNTQDKLAPQGGGKDIYQGMNTEFVVRSTLKGDPQIE